MRDRARRRRVEAGDELGERRLARARDADERDALALRQVEVDAVQHVVAGVVGVRDAARTDRGAARRRGSARVGGRLQPRDAHEARERRQRALGVVGETEHDVELVEEPHEEQRAGGRAADRQRAVADEQEAGDEHGRRCRRARRR